MPDTRALTEFLARERSGLGERLLPALREHLAQQAVLEGLISARQAGLFKPEELVLIDISGSAWDTGEAIVARAAERLNSDAHWRGFQCMLD